MIFEIIYSQNILFYSYVSHSVMSDYLQPHGCSLLGSSVHGILKARILDWVAISFSGYLPTPGIEPGSPALQADSSPPNVQLNLHITKSNYY